MFVSEASQVRLYPSQCVSSSELPLSGLPGYCREPNTNSTDMRRSPLHAQKVVDACFALSSGRTDPPEVEPSCETRPSHATVQTFTRLHSGCVCNRAQEESERKRENDGTPFFSPALSNNNGQKPESRRCRRRPRRLIGCAVRCAARVRCRDLRVESG